MPFMSLGAHCPDLEEAETRFVTLLGAQDGLPADVYTFRELYCDEAGCDCRRVLLSVVSSSSSEAEAVINFGWENRKFYADWLTFPEPDLVDELKGPALHLGPRQGPRADAVLRLAKRLLLSDPEYVARLQRHYAAFRAAVPPETEPPDTVPPETEPPETAPLRTARIAGRNDPCPCGSGRKFKRCCGAPGASSLGADGARG